MAKAKSKRAVKIVQEITQMPETLTFDSSGEELVFDRSTGPDTAIYLYTKSETKLGKEIQLSMRQINSRYKNSV